MKTVSTYTGEALDSPHVEPVRLLVWEFDGLTLYICDRVFGDAGTVCVFAGQIYEPIAIELGPVEHGAINPLTLEVNPSEARSIFDNSIPIGGADCLTALFSTYDPHYSTVTIKEFYRYLIGRFDYIDLTDFDENDVAADRISIDSARQIIITDVSSLDTDAEDIFVNDDYGADYFLGDDPLEVRFHFKATKSEGSGVYSTRLYPFALSNSDDTIKAAIAASEDALGLYFYDSFGTRTFYLSATDAGASDDWDISAHLSLNADYYIKIIYDPNVGAYGTVTAEIYTDSGFTTSHDTLEITLGKAYSFRYMSVVSNYTGAINGTLSCVLKDYMIQAQNPVAADAIDIFKGTVEDFPEMSTDRLSVSFSGYELDVANKFTHEIVDTDDFSGADPDDVGKMLPVVYGSAKKVPFLALEAGVVSTIAEVMTITDPGDGDTLAVATDRFEGKVSFGIQVDNEQISCASASGYTITLASSDARGINTTDAVSHELGAMVAEVLTSYVYAIGHAVKAFDQVYVWDQTRQVWFIPDSDDYDTYTGQTGDQLAGYGARACIEFSVLPLLAKQIGLDPGVDTGSHAHTTSASNQTTRTGTSHSDPQSSWTSESNAYDGNDATYATGNTVDANDYLIIYFNETDLGTVISRRVKITYSSQLPTYLAYHRIQCGTATAQFFPGTGGDHTTKTTIYKTFSGDSWDLDVKISTDYGLSPNMTVHDVEVEVTYGDAIDPNGADGVTVTFSGNSSADTVIGGMVAADVQGFQDDGSGTYTGTPSALIERPDHVCKHILGERCGLTLADVVDTTSYNAAGTFYGSTYKMAFALLARPNVRNLLARIAQQAKTFGIWEAGKHKLKHVPAGAESTDATLDENRIDLGQIWPGFTPRKAIINTLSATYDRDWSGHGDDLEADQAIVNAYDSTSGGKYGSLQAAAPYSFPYIPETTQAQAVLDWFKAMFANPRLEVELAGGYYLSQLERGDVVEFDFTSGDELDKALLRLVTANSDQFRIIDQKRRNDGTIQVTAIKI